MRGLKQIEPRETAHVIEGLRFALHSVRASFRILKNRSFEIENLSGKENNFDLCFETINCCWSIVDHANRARQLVESKHLIGVDKSARKLFLIATIALNDIRNVFHHLSGRSKQLGDSSAPVMGSICWISRKDAQKCYTLILSSGAVLSQYHSLTYDRLDRRFLGDFTFSAFGKSVQLADLVDATGQFESALEKFLERIGALLETEVQGIALSMHFSGDPESST